MKECLDRAVKFQLAEGSVRACEAWLTRHYLSEYPPTDEILPPLVVPPPSLDDRPHWR